MAERIVGFSESDWPIARNAINQVHRGGTDHPYYRRQNIAGGAEEPRLVKNGTTDKIGGPRNSGGISHEVLCYFVDADGNHSTDAADRVTVNFSRLNAVCFCADNPTTHMSTSNLYCAWVIPWQDGKYLAICGGTAYFEGETQADSMVLPGLGFVDTPEVECTGFCGEEFPENTGVAVQVYGEELRIIATCCPGQQFPEEE